MSERVAAFRLRRSRSRWRQGRKPAFHSSQRRLRRPRRAARSSGRRDRWLRLPGNRGSSATAKPLGLSARQLSPQTERLPEEDGFGARTMQRLRCWPVVWAERFYPRAALRLSTICCRAQTNRQPVVLTQLSRTGLIPLPTFPAGL